MLDNNLNKFEMKLLKFAAVAILSNFVRSFHQSCIKQKAPFGEAVGDMVTDFEMLDLYATKDMRVR